MNYIYLLIEYLKQWLASDDILYKLLAILIILFILFVVWFIAAEIKNIFKKLRKKK